jgi:hypothetical protein
MKDLVFNIQMMHTPMNYGFTYGTILHKAAVGCLLAFGLLIAGCEQLPKRDPQVVATPDKVSLMMAEAADKASNRAGNTGRSRTEQIAPVSRYSRFTMRRRNYSALSR